MYRIGAFKDIKEQVAEDVMLTYPDYSPEARKMEPYVDASGSGSFGLLSGIVPVFLSVQSGQFPNTTQSNDSHTICKYYETLKILLIVVFIHERYFQFLCNASSSLIVDMFRPSGTLNILTS